jgi:hypothetical protein
VTEPTDDTDVTVDSLMNINAPYKQMLHELRDEHGENIDSHIRSLVQDAIHESYKELNSD